MHCLDCGQPFEPDSKSYKYCKSCREAYGREMQRESESFPPPKGRDRVTERLRDGFQMLDDDDPERD